MGLSKDVIILDDITVSSAYFRLLKTAIDWEAKTVSFVIGCWKSKAACKNGKQALPVMISEPLPGSIVRPGFSEVLLRFTDASAIATRAQQYDMIKALVPFFADAQDVIEN